MSNSSKKIAVVLMSKLSDYMLNCFKAWQASSNIELHVVRQKVDSREAPFEFSQDIEGITFYEREAMNDEALKALVRDTKPQVVICFGWADRGYIGAVSHRTSDTPAVITMDNQWHGTMRQWLGLVWSRIFLCRLFDFIWVPGDRQRRFASLLGFREDQIREGLYVANASNFDPICDTFVGAPVKRLVFMGRYVDAKGVRELWQGFISYHEQNQSDIELVCIGAGPLRDAAPEHPRIRHLGFVQPKDLAQELAGGGIFILPSRYEPWGLVVQEFALAGFPLVLSQPVGAGDRFLGPDNGLLIKAVTPKAIACAVSEVDSLDPETLAKMSRASVRRGKTLSIDNWCAQANAFTKFRGTGGRL